MWLSLIEMVNLIWNQKTKNKSILCRLESSLKNCVSKTNIIIFYIVCWHSLICIPFLQYQIMQLRCYFNVSSAINHQIVTIAIGLSVIDKLSRQWRAFSKTVCRDSRQGVGYKVTAWTMSWVFNLRVVLRLLTVSIKALFLSKILSTILISEFLILF